MNKVSKSGPGQHSGYSVIVCVQSGAVHTAPCTHQEAKYVKGWPSTISAWAGWSRFDIPVDRYGGVHSLLICTSSILGSSTCHQASQKDNTYRAKYQKADRASTLYTPCVHTIDHLYVSKVLAALPVISCLVFA